MKIKITMVERVGAGRVDVKSIEEVIMLAREDGHCRLALGALMMSLDQPKPWGGFGSNGRAVKMELMED